MVRRPGFARANAINVACEADRRELENSLLANDRSQSADQGDQFGLTSRIGLKEDCLELAASGFSVDTERGGSVGDTASRSNASGESSLRPGQPKNHRQERGIRG